MKKLLALAVSGMMLFSAVPAALAEESEAVASTAEAVVTEPTLLANFNSMTVGSQIATNKVTGSWGAYSKARYASTFQQEDSGNVYLKITDMEIEGDTKSTTGIYGAFFQLNDAAVTGENVAVEMKVRIPKSEMNKRIELRLRGDYLTGNPATEHPESNTYNSGVYIVGSLTASDNGYVYRDYYTTGETKNTVILTDYDEQWISLKWMVDTTTDTCKIYCNGNEKVAINDARFYPKGEMDSIISNIKYVQVCIPNGTNEYDENGTLVKKNADGGEIWIDDVLFYTDATSGDSLSAQIPSFASLEDETVSTDIVNVDLIKSDDSSYGNQFGLIITPPDTSMVGKYKAPVANVNGVTADWNVCRMSTKTSYNFDNDETEYVQTSSSNAQTNDVAESLSGKALKLGVPVSTARNKEYIATNVSAESDIVKYDFDMYWTAPKADQTFYLNLNRTLGGNLALEVAFTLKANGSFNAKTNKLLLFSGNISANTMQKYSFVINRKEKILETYLNGNLASTWTFKELGGAGVEGSRVQYIESEIAGIYYNTYVPGNYSGDQLTSYLANLTDIYLDNISVSASENVASVDVSGVETEVKVVCGRVPALTKTVATVLTDGTTDVLPIEWDAVDTSVLGEITVRGTVSGFETEPVTATVTVIEYPYEVSIADGKINVAQTTEYAPEAKLYVVSYTDEGDMTGVVSYDVSGEREFDATGNVKAFLFAETLKPLAMSAE